MLAGVAGPVSAREFQAGSVRVVDPWTRAAPAGADGVGFLTVTNDGPGTARLTGAGCPAAAATSIEDAPAGNTTASPSLAGIDIPPGETVKLMPRGLHLSLHDLKQRLVRGDMMTCRLAFGGAKVEVPFLVRSAKAVEPLMGRPQ